MSSHDNQRCKCDRCEHKHKHEHKKRCNANMPVKCQLREVISNENWLDFQVQDFFEFWPGDPIVAAGPEQVIVMNNASTAIIDKKTQQRIYLDSNTNLFRIGKTFYNETCRDFPFGVDPWAIYDELSERFFLCVAYFILNEQFERVDTEIYIAVSKTSTPTSGSDFHTYKLSDPYDNLFADFPKAGTDQRAYYISTVDFDPLDDTNFTAHIVGLDKQALMNGDPLDIIYEETFPEQVQLFPIQTRSPIKDVHQPMYFVEMVPNVVDPVSPWILVEGNKVRIYGLIYNDINDFFGFPFPIMESFEVEVSPYLGVSRLIGVPQPSPPDVVPLEAAPSNFLGTGVLYKDSIWVAHHVYTGEKTVARWYEFDVSKFLDSIEPYYKVSLVQEGNVDPKSTDNTFYPAINVDKDGNMGISFSISGPDRFVSVGYTGRLKKDPLGSIRLPVQIAIDGQLTYEAFLPATGGRNRWGDYSGLAMDPEDNKTFWIYNMYPVPTQLQFGGGGVPGPPGPIPEFLTDADWTTLLASFCIDKTTKAETPNKPSCGNMIKKHTVKSREITRKAREVDTKSKDVKGTGWVKAELKRLE